MIRNKVLVVVVCGAIVAGLFLILANRSPADPVVMAENPVVHVGKAPQHSSVSHIYRVKNLSRSPVHIKKIGSSCGCAGGLVVDSADSIEAGGFVDVKVTFKTGSRMGLSEEHAFVAFEEKHIQPVGLTLKCYVSAPISWSPLTAKFGRIPKGSDYERTIMLREDTEKPLGEVKITTDSEHVQATIKDMPDPGVREWDRPPEYLLKIVLSKDVPVGPFYSKVVVEPHDKSQKPIEVPVTAEVYGDLGAQASSAFFGTIAPDQIKTITFDIRRNLNSDANVVIVRSNNEAVQGRIVERHDDGPVAARIEATCDGTKCKEKTLSAALDIETTSEIVPVIQVQLVGLLTSR